MRGLPERETGGAPSRPVRAMVAPGLLLSALLGAFIGIATYTADYAEATSYLSNDPKACVNCHVMRDAYDSWQHSSHHAVAVCNDCHVPHDLVGKYLAKVDHGYRHSKAFTLQNFPEPIRINQHDLELVLHNCVRCHQALTADVRPPAVGAWDAHASGALDCIRCHTDVGHAGKLSPTVHPEGSSP